MLYYPYTYTFISSTFSQSSSREFDGREIIAVSSVAISMMYFAFSLMAGTAGCTKTFFFLILFRLTYCGCECVLSDIFILTYIMTNTCSQLD